MLNTQSTLEYKERWNFRASSSCDISFTIALATSIISDELIIRRNL